jgi:hypothetical protein
MVSTNIKGMAGTHNDIGEKSGFVTEGYLRKGGIPSGDAKFNVMPPGMDITNQPTTEQNPMPFKMVVSESYPGDGWEPTPRDIPE